MWIIGYAILIWMVVMRPNFIIWMLLVMSLPRLLSLFRRRTAEEVEFYTITPAQRWKMALLYFGLIAALAFQMHSADAFLHQYHAH